MNQLNSIILEGNVVADATLTNPISNFTVGKFAIAVNRTSRNPQGETVEEVSYFDVECYGEMAEKVEKYAKKGQGVRIVGRLKQSRYEENGVKHSRIYLIAEHIEYKFRKANPEPKEEKQAVNF